MNLNLDLTMLRRISFIFLLSRGLGTHADIYTAITELEYLIEPHQKIIDDLRLHIEKEEKKLSILKRYLDMYEREHKNAIEDIPKYLGNPIKAFTLIKRLTSDLDYMNYIVKVETEVDFKNVTRYYKNNKYPTVEDIVGAAQALTKIQETYNLNITELAEGRLNGTTYNTPMTACDCFEVARTLYKTDDFVNSLSWIFEALRKYNEEENSYPFSAVNIIEIISFGYYAVGDFSSALYWARNIIELDPNNTKAKEISEMCHKGIENENITMKVKLHKKNDERRKLGDPMDKLCRGEIDISKEISSRLTCSYWSHTHPFLKLAPLKAEMMYFNPDIILFHDILNDNEIESIKQMTKPLLARCKTNNPNTNQPATTNSRICKYAWLNDKQSDTVTRISRRVTHMTGLSLETAEDMQVINYGIGGYYKSHYDFAMNIGPVKWASGNRIATVLFYMSDVALGGSTVFPEIGLSIYPRKGAAAFWYNLHASGEGDLATRHAACPVLQGDKWVCSKWIHQVGQEFRRPCNLEYQAESIIHEIPHPVLKSSKY